MYEASKNRYEKMKYMKCGNSGLKLPRIAFGFWHNFGRGFDTDTMRELMRTAFDEGITYFDLANNYGPPYGEAERNFGKLFKADFAKYRNELVIATKAGFDMWPGPYGDHGSRKYLITSLDDSLKRMGLDYVDIYYHHRPDPETPLFETCRALDDIVRSGKALYVGISNYNKEQTEAAAKIFKKLGTPFIVNQIPYSLFNRQIERNGLRDYAAENGIGLVAFCPLAQGLLTGKYDNGIPSDSRIKTDGRYLHQDDVTKSKLDRIKIVSELAKKRGQTTAETALSWVLREDKVTTALIGASKPEQIRENVRAIENTDFSDEEIRILEKVQE